MLVGLPFASHRNLIQDRCNDPWVRARVVTSSDTLFLQTRLNLGNVDWVDRFMSGITFKSELCISCRFSFAFFKLSCIKDESLFYEMLSFRQFLFCDIIRFFLYNYLRSKYQGIYFLSFLFVVFYFICLIVWYTYKLVINDLTILLEASCF